MDDVRQLRPRKARPQTNRRWVPRLIGAVIILALIGGSALRFWVDLMWFDELNQRGVFTTRLQWSLVVGVVTGAIAFAAMLASLTYARRVARDDMFVPFLRAPESTAPDQPVISHRMMKPIALGVSALVGVLAGVAVSGRWETVLGFVGRSKFGIDDPLFGHDLSFYVFTLPLLELVTSILQVIVVVIFLATAATYVATGVIRYTPVPRISRAGAAHLAVFAGLYLVFQAVQFRLSAWNLVHSEHPVATGAGFVDRMVRLPGSWVMVVASLVAAVLVFLYARKEKWRRVGTVVVGWVVLTTIVMSAAPALVQKVSVDPNELQREKHILANNIKLTRIGYGLDSIKERPFVDEATLTAEQFAANTATTSNIRLWSPDVLGQTLEQIQTFRPYYIFNDVDVDRYTIDGKYRQVMLSAREMEVTKLGSRTWINEHLQYTHGYGVVGAWPNLATRQGRPELFIRDIPPVPSGQTDLKVTRPEIYFGEAPENYVMVGSRESEFDYPKGDDNKFANYEGKGGIPVGNVFRRLAFAVNFKDQKLLLTGSIKPSSRVLFRRNIVERINELAPFLRIESDPYIVVKKNGRLVWIVDAYTTTDRLPYSQYSDLPDGKRINYVRNSVKAVVDAYDGTVKLYDVSEGKDPILATWSNIFPNLFVDGKKMPKELVSHLRFPEDMFNLQSDRWLTYHMGSVDKNGNVTDQGVKNFYNREDVWANPELDETPLQAFYVLARLPGEATEELLLVKPIVPAGKKNLIAYMGARMDPGHYGQIFNLKLSKQSLTQGPQQVSARIRQDEEIATQITLWSKGGTQPVFGNLLVLPIESSLLYVQPIYLQSTEAKLPEFERVVLVLGDTIAWGESFPIALKELLRRKGEDTQAITDSETDAGTGEKPADSGPAPTDAELNKLIDQIGVSYNKALECQKAGDWACYGEETKKVGELLREAGIDVNS